MVKKVLHSMHWDYNLDQYDLLQTGYIGLIKAVDKYNPSKGAFSTFAVSYIEGYIRRELYRLQGAKESDAPVYKVMKEIEREYCEKVSNNPSLAKKVADVVTSKGIKYFYDENVRRTLFLSPVSLEEVLEENEDESIYNLGYEVEDNSLNYIYENEKEKVLNEQIKCLNEKKSE